MSKLEENLWSIVEDLKSIFDRIIIDDLCRTVQELWILFGTLGQLFGDL